MNRNSEHYADPTASGAMDTVSRTQPIVYGNVPVFVNGQTTAQRQKARGKRIEDMTMDEVTTHIYSCAKAKMNVKNCAECTKDGPGCAFGRRAMALAGRDANQVTVTEPEHTDAAEPRGLDAYRAAIESGDVLMYAFMHTKNPDPKKAKAAAYVKVSTWRKKYGHLVDEPAAQKEAGGRVELTDMKRVMTSKIKEELESLKDIEAEFKDLVEKKAKIASQIENLAANKHAVMQNINAISTTASMLGIKLDVETPHVQVEKFEGCV